MSRYSKSGGSKAVTASPAKKDSTEQDFSKYWEGSDVTFRVEGKELFASRVILGMWSPVFKAMFFGEYKEKNERVIKLPGKKFNEMIMLVKVTHPPSVDITDDNVHLVLPLAEEYQMDKILKQCEAVLLAQPKSIPNLVTARQYGFSKLDETCMDFAKKTPLGSLSEADFDYLDPKTCSNLFKFKVKCLEPLVTLLKDVRKLAEVEKLDCSKCSYRYCLACDSELGKARGAVLGPRANYLYNTNRNRTMCTSCTSSRLEKIYDKVARLDPEKLFDEPKTESEEESD